MRKKYIQPSMEVVEMVYNSRLLAGSGETGADVYGNAPEGAYGLARDYDFWEDEE